MECKKRQSESWSEWEYCILWSEFQAETFELALARIFQLKRSKDKCRSGLIESRCSAFFFIWNINVCAHWKTLHATSTGTVADRRSLKIISVYLIISSISQSKWPHCDFHFISKCIIISRILSFSCERQFGASYTINSAIKSNQLYSVHKNRTK